MSKSFILLIVFALTMQNMAYAGEKRRICVFDIAGATGPAFTAMKDWRAEALQWSDFNIELVAYTNERIAAEELKAGQCDGALLTGLRSRSFNHYTGSLDSIGAIPSYDHMKKVIQVLSHPKYAEKVRNGSYEIGGVIPLGAAYIFVRDRSINTLTKAAGKKVAVLDFDKSQAEMVSLVGASPVSSDVTNFGSKFNNGSVDIIAAPAAAFNALELYKGLEPDGGIIRFPLAQISFQLVFRQQQFPPEFAQSSRTYIYGRIDEIVEAVNKETAHIHEKYWVDIPEADKAEYEVMMQEARVRLREAGYYHPEMMSLLKKVRCKFDAARPECTTNVE